MAKLVCKKCGGTLFVPTDLVMVHSIYVPNGTPPRIEIYQCENCGNREEVYYPSVVREIEPQEIELPDGKKDTPISTSTNINSAYVLATKIQKKRNKMKIKKCPICGSEPTLNIEPLFREGGGGYDGCYDYSYGCKTCERVRGNADDTIYRTEPEARENAIKYWNDEVNIIERFLKKKQHNN